MAQVWGPDDAGEPCCPAEGLHHDAEKVRGEVSVLLQAAESEAGYTVPERRITVMNEGIRKLAKDRGVRLWEVAELYGVNDGNFSRRLRHELPENEKNIIKGYIELIAKKHEKEENSND